MFSSISHVGFARGALGSLGSNAATARASTGASSETSPPSRDVRSSVSDRSSAFRSNPRAPSPLLAASRALGGGAAFPVAERRERAPRGDVPAADIFTREAEVRDEREINQARLEAHVRLLRGELLRALPRVRGAFECVAVGPRVVPVASFRAATSASMERDGTRGFRALDSHHRATRPPPAPPALVTSFRSPAGLLRSIASSRLVSVFSRVSASRAARRLAAASGSSRTRRRRKNHRARRPPPPPAPSPDAFGVPGPGPGPGPDPDASRAATRPRYLLEPTVNLSGADATRGEAPGGEVQRPGVERVLGLEHRRVDAARSRRVRVAAQRHGGGVRGVDRHAHELTELVQELPRRDAPRSVVPEDVHAPVAREELRQRDPKRTHLGLGEVATRRAAAPFTNPIAPGLWWVMIPIERNAPRPDSPPHFSAHSCAIFSSELNRQSKYTGITPASTDSMSTSAKSMREEMSTNRRG